jgi:hypothetical protein
MKQIVITVALLAIALALVIGVIIPLFQHGAETGNNAVAKGSSAIPRIEQILK